MTEEQRQARIHHHMYETCEGIQEHAVRIVALEELVELAERRVEALSSFAREYLHRYGYLMKCAGEDVTDEVLAIEGVINAIKGSGGTSNGGPEKDSRESE